MGDTVNSIVGGIPATLIVTLASFAVGCIVGIPVAAGTRARLLVTRFVARLLIDVVRGVPPIVWLFLIFYGAGQYFALTSYTAAILGLGMVSTAYMAEVYASGMLAVRRGQAEAASALGLTQFQALIRVIGPQALRVAVPGGAAFLIGLLKDSAVISIIGIQDVASRALTDYQQSFDGIRAFGFAALVYLVLSVPIAIFSRAATRRLRAGLAR